MPHIIFLLLIASSPFFIHGDETASWGSLQSGPSESECRPFIEKALKGASIPDSNEPRDTDDVGESEYQEEDATITEASEDVPPDLQEPSSEEQNSNEKGNQPEAGSNEPDLPLENIEESAEITTSQQNIENQEKNEDISVEDINEPENIQKISSEEGKEQSSQELTSHEDNIVSTEQIIPSDDLIDPEEEVKDKDYETEEADSEKPIDPETLNKSVEEEEQIVSETSSIEQLEPELANNSETEIESQNEISEPVHINAPEVKDQIESGESREEPETENTVEIVEENESLNEVEIKEDTNKSDEATEVDIGSEENVTAEVITSDNIIEEELGTESSEEISVILSEETKDSPDQQNSNETEILEKESHEAEEVTSDDKGHSEEKINDSPIISSKEEEIDQIEVPSNTVETSQNTTDSSLEEVKKQTNDDISVESEEETNKENVVLEGEAVVEEASPEEELSMIMEIPEHLRSRDHMVQILRLSTENEEIEKALGKIADSTLRELKKLYDVAIKPLEILYKYRDLSNRHFGDPEIFSKPLILFMGPWSGGKSTIINYLLENEYKKTALRTGAEPSPAYFNIVMWGEIEEVLDGTQLAADWTFSGLQKFGQGLLDRLRGLKLNHPLLEKVNIVEIPGILEIRKQVERLFPFNDACQWFIDRADIIFLVYDPSKLDVGPETEAILDQLKGREMQTKIILNKADQVKPEELMRVQGTLIWNISPLMSSTEPPIMYSTSLWSIPYESGSPTRLLYAQERAFLKDLREAIDKRVENKIASARRFAVRVRNHAKMVDCYLTTYYNHKSFFGNKKKISDDIIEHPQNYHIYEGLSTLTNISRYDLPDPDVYRDFFRLNPVYEFQQLSSTCTYFRGCPINRLDVAIAYDLPELVGKYKKHVEEVLNYSKK